MQLKAQTAAQHWRKTSLGKHTLEPAKVKLQTLFHGVSQHTQNGRRKSQLSEAVFNSFKGLSKLSRYVSYHSSSSQSPLMAHSCQQEMSMQRAVRALSFRFPLFSLSFNAVWKPHPSLSSLHCSQRCSVGSGVSGGGQGALPCSPKLPRLTLHDRVLLRSAANMRPIQTSDTTTLRYSKKIFRKS